MTQVSAVIKKVTPDIRYVAVNSNGKILEMEQFVPSNNPHDTDRMEELLVNPTVLELTTRRGNLDLNGVEYVIIRYGTQYQAIFNYGKGHVSVGIELDQDPVATIEKIRKALFHTN